MPKLTPEEKKLLRAQKKAEKKRLAAERQRQIKFDYLAREVKYGNLTIQRYEKKWEDLLMKISVTRMREDLRYAWHNFERIIDSKDFTISLLMDEVRDAEEQYLINIRNHNESIDRLIRMFRDKLQEMKEDNQRELEELQSRAGVEADTIKASAENEENYLKTMLHGLELESKAHAKQVRGEYLSKIDEEEKKYADTIQTLKSGLEKRLEQLWNTTQEFIKSHENRTCQRQKDYVALKQQDDSLQLILAQQLLKIKKFYDLIKTLKQRYAEVEKTQQSVIDDLTLEKNYFNNIFFTLKRRLETDTARDKQHLVLLTEKSNEIINILGEYKQKGKWMLTLGAVFRKMETLHEKILPFPMPPVSRQVTKSVADLTVTEFDSDDLYLFWHRVGEADALRYSMNEEREFLIRDNELLQKKIHSYCRCFDCPSTQPKETNAKESFTQTSIGPAYNEIDENKKHSE